MREEEQRGSNDGLRGFEFRVRGKVDTASNALFEWSTAIQLSGISA